MDLSHLTGQDTASPGLSRRRVAAITLVCFAVSMIDGFDTLMLSFVAPLLSKSLHIDPASLGRVFGAGFIGTVVGSLIAGPLADRFGRRRTLVAALLMTGIFTLACAWATSATEMSVLRLLGGLGMGGAIPPVTAITAESAPIRRRSALVILMFIGFPLGAVVGGAVSAVLMMRFGWPFVFQMGGAFALLVIAPVLWVLPASTAQASGRNDALGDARHPGAALREPQAMSKVFGHGRFVAATALWIGVLATMILSGFLVSFMPTLLHLNGVPPDRAAMGAVILNVGAILGALILSGVVGRAGPFVPVATSFIGGAVLTAVLGNVIGQGQTVFPMLFAVGACLVGGQLTFPAIASRLFPMEVRAAGVGGTMAIGRLGSIIGPTVGGWLIAREMPLSQMFLLASVLAVVGAVGVSIARWKTPPETERAASVDAPSFADSAAPHGDMQHGR
ncbi:MFS transporter [Pandoraea fibrosis]|uniref:MFS transporter n=1 Tax=Pandoraea fibrosis TaxID=1891094 RepID=A0ABX6HME7_9BURK|nr:MFS transporter [Pandoraea fibrosis]QHE90976.1 MFS transporter [Pandoraea fibrosis]QHF11807.1 MFS transporter [Pandoraea fibrosis]